MRPLVLASLGLLALGASLGAGDSPALTLVKTIPLPGVTGRFDHFAVDLKGQRL